ncbi:PREDICTED: G-type lectin S-receptor-like serine/threonine-protein kinase RLK1 [Nicotiana attenuata]|uniref:Receptor-like serine/threonine-protein kinase n=1 Tax=Nicotiana attenuata TaxID=49451 RepID=A0A1J6K2D7_NICAT|nr:PREDICTED: G-type lectin S-receptor-like serine/threonine-protein kinase RLK1 [Nicotiana attenuata]OIT22796.1 g-type lectin s-receptor-like serinethreonine-protein kinase rlk1 [Nicotiana attenuata]
MVSSFFYLLLFLFFFPLHNLAQNNGRVATSTSLTATDGTTPWFSPSGDFAFGFQKLQNKDQFLLCIWYAKIQEKTIVWHANISNPVPRGSRLQLDSQNGLILSDTQGNTIWRTDLVIGNIDHGFMNDTGNFVIMGNDSTDPLWESFRNPIDTLLPSQTLERGSFLVSQRSEANFSQGRFYLRMVDNGNLVLGTKSVPSNSDYDDEYYNSRTSDEANVTNSGDKLVFEENGMMYILKRNNERQFLTPRSIPSASENYHRVTLNFDGVLTHYYRSRSSNSSGWNILWAQPDNICFNIFSGGIGACGYNNVCNLGTNKRPVCNCPKGYSLLDPNDIYGSCKPDSAVSCDEVGRGSPEDLYNFITVRDTDWPTSDFQKLSPSTEQDCQSFCLNDCFCAVAIYRSDSCWTKKLPLWNGRIDTSLNAKAFIKIRKNGIPPLSPGLPNPGSCQSKNWRNWAVVSSTLLGSSVLVNVLFIGVFCWVFFHIYKKKAKTLRPRSRVADSICHSFTYKELIEATTDFEEELGRGAFGIVYKGVMPIGSRNVVAVKKLDRVAHETEKEFMTEVNVISQTHHKNLVRLLGYCNEGAHRLLVYEYMSNGTLASHLFGDQKPTWSQRTKVAMGIARGLAYLHEECSTQIIHCDIKPQNILLDDHYIARISDFGLSKLLMMNQSRTLTNIRGTRGYVAPEWFRNSQVTVKVDVFSFGVLLLEIITCRKSLENEESYGPEAILTDWVLDCFQEGKFEALVETDTEALNDKKQLERFVMVGIWCIQEDSTMRPTMRKVTQMLEGSVEVTTPPCPYTFSTTI